MRSALLSCSVVFAEKRELSNNFDCSHYVCIEVRQVIGGYPVFLMFDAARVLKWVAGKEGTWTAKRVT